MSKYSEKLKDPRYKVYFIKCGDYIKIGISRDLPCRINTLQTGHFEKLILMGTKTCASRAAAFACEQALHDYFSTNRISGEWFYIPKFDGYDEDTDTLVIGDGGIGLWSIWKRGVFLC